MTESFFASLECELLDRTRFRTRAEARLALFDYIERFYNRRRRHSSLGYLAPADFERRAREADLSRSPPVPNRDVSTGAGQLQSS